MIAIQNSSPFIQQAKECHLLKRRTSKKIKKISSSMLKPPTNLLNKTTSSNNLIKDNSDLNNILNILNQRAVPGFLIQLVKKKRIFNLGSIKKMVISSSSNQEGIEQMQSRCRKQQQQLKYILSQNKARFEMRKKMSSNTQSTTPKRSVNGNVNNIINNPTRNQTNSSTLSLQEQQIMDEQFKGDVSMFHSNMMDFEQSMDYIRHELDDEDIFLTMF